MLLDHEIIGRGERLVLVHGFTQTRRCWGSMADDLACDHEVVLIDAPGHGGSASFDRSFVDSADVITATGGRGTYIGYSMGGRLCLRAALDHPDVVAGLVLIGASPGLADPGERTARRAADDALAERIESIGIDAFLDEWLAQPIFAGLSPEAAARHERLQNTTIGLSSSLRRSGTGAQEPLWDRLASLGMPVLLITGERDTKFTQIARLMTEAIGAYATHLVVPGAGHTVHLEAPGAFLAGLRSWLAIRR